MMELPIQKGYRKFKESPYYDAGQSKGYFLLPFRFHKLNQNKEVLVNEVGDFLIVPVGTAEKIILKQLSAFKDPDLYGDLIANFFISEQLIPPLIDVFATRYRTKKSFLDNFTSLHLFVITLRCEHTCHYCQVSRVTTEKDKFDMSTNHIHKGIDMMLNSPSSSITMEFQGGEALLAFDKIVYAIERTKKLAIAKEKNITYVICTNLAVLDEDILRYCKENDVLISTSLDGPDFIHNQNRRRPGNNSYELTIKGLNLAKKIIGKDKVSALMTATTLSLNHPVEIVDEYYNQGFRSIFLRPISPYGFALKNEKKNKYAMTNFLSFYKIALKHIININLEGEFFREQYATIILKKILTPFPVGYVDLNSPTGSIINAVVFNYDGAVYASDESRMLAESKDYTFKLGHLDSSTYQDIFYGEKVQELSDVMCNESLPGCSECAFLPYCGSDPVHNYSTQGDVWGYRPTSTFCQKNMEIIRHLFELMDNDKRVRKIFESWVKLN